MQPGRERRLVTAAVMAGMFLAAIEATAVATAMPTIVAELGGVGRYAWAFSAYLLTSTTTVPMFGKLADLYGRRRVFTISVGIFLLGSTLCGMAGTLEQLLVFRALQGVGAGGLIPVAVTVVGDIYPLAERGRVQGVFAGVWALASLLGPLLGGAITELFSWRWVFLFNLPFGVLAAVLLWLYLREEPPARARRLDIVGTVTLTAAVSALLWVLQESGPHRGWLDAVTLGLTAAAALGLAIFVWQERRAVEPMLPVDLLRNRVIAVASAGTVIIGLILFTLVAYVPVYAQVVRGDNAAEAGAILMAMSLGWPFSSTIAGHVMLRTGYRALAMFGSTLCAIGCGLLAAMSGIPSRLWLLVAMLLIGLGLGLISTPYIVAVQAAVPYTRRGAATSAQQFFRTMAGAIIVAAVGAAFNAMVTARVHDAGAVQRVLDPATRGLMTSAELSLTRGAVGAALHVVFVFTAGCALAGVVVAALFPRGAPEQHAHRS